MTSRLFRRTTGQPVTAVSGSGAWVVDEFGRRYLDGAGGAVAATIGHGDGRVAEAMRAQAAKLEYVHAAAFTNEPAERYASALGPVLPFDDGRVFPVSGGAEAVETAFKLARSYHLARGEPDRHVIVSRRGSYHGNTRGALDASHRPSLRAPYEPWLGMSARVEAPYEYRCPAGSAHPSGCGTWHAERLEDAFEAVGPHRVAAFVAEPVSGATLAAAVPPHDYWSAVGEVCRRYGALVVADEVMTGFGRTGRWFAVDHWGFRPDILVAAKGASSGYWPLGLCVATAEVHDAVAEGGFAHGFTWSHHPIGAAVGLAVLERIRDDGLVERSAQAGARLLTGLRDRLSAEPAVGDVRGLGLLVGLELVADRASRRPFPRHVRLVEEIVASARRRGILVYSSSGHVDGDGDLLLLGPPLVIADDELELLADGVSGAIHEAAGSPAGLAGA